MKSYLETALLIFLGFFIVFLLTWPFLTKIRTYYPDTTEYVLNGWLLWYNQHSLLTGKIFDRNAYFSSNQFYPFPFSLAYSENTFIPSMIFAPIYWISKNLTFSVNYFYILTFVLSFISSYFCLKLVVKKSLPSLVGAFVFTFNPLTFSQYFGHHLQFMNKYFLPPLFLFAYLYIKNPTWKKAFYFYLFFTLNALSNIYFQIFSIIFIPIFWSPFLFSMLIKKNIKFFINFLKTSLIFILFLPFLYHFNHPYLQFSKWEGVTRSIYENSANSARGIDWILSLRTNLLYGRFVQNLHFLREPKNSDNSFNYTEHTLFINLIPLILFIIGLSALKLNRAFTGLILVLIFSMVFTFGPYFALFYERLYNTLYFLKGIRVPTRFQFIFYIPFALIVSLGTNRLLRYSGKKAPLIFCLISFFLILENINFTNFDTPSQILPYLASENIKQPQLITTLKSKNTIHFPIITQDIGNNIRYLNWSTITAENIFNGYSGYYPADWLYLAHKAKIDKKSLEKFYLLGIDFLIIHKKLINQGELKDYHNNLDFLKSGILFQDDEIVVISLKKINLNPPICFLRDLEFEINTKSYPVAQSLGVNFQLFPSINLVNPKYCYVVNKNMERYSKIDINIKGKIQSMNVKLPILIEPFSKLKLN